MKRLLVASVAAAGLLPLAVFAAQFHAGELYTLQPGEAVADDLYIAGQALKVNGNVTGDLFAAGRAITVLGNVTKDATLVGGEVTIAGIIGDDLRVAGGEVTIAGDVKGDVIAAGGRVRILESAVISGDLIVAGAEVRNMGTVQGQVREYTRGERPDGALGVAMFTWWLVKILMGSALGLLLWRFLKEPVARVLQEASRNFWKEFIRGLVAMIAFPLGIIAALVTVIGAPIALIGFFLYVSAMIVSSVLAGILLGSYAWKWLQRKDGLHITWQSVILGVALYETVKLIPVLGWILTGFIFLATFGSIFSWGWKRFRA